MANVKLDPQGRLLSFQAVPPTIDERPDEKHGLPPTPDWLSLFAEAGLEMANFKQTGSRWAPPMGYDSRAAWEGVFPNQPQIPLRIEAAAYRGRPIWFEMIGPWVTPPRGTPVQQSSFTNLFLATFFLTIALLGVLLTRRNLRLGRGDRKGALRLAFLVFSLYLLSWVCGANHVPTVKEFDLFTINLSAAMLVAGVTWLYYLALEPYVRRHWPHRIIGWSRLLAGHVRDPLVGHDLLMGGLFAIGNSLLVMLALKWPAPADALPRFAGFLTLQGYRGVVSSYLLIFPLSMLVSLSSLLLVMMISRLLRREWLAFGLVAILVTFAQGRNPFLGSGFLLFGITITVQFIVLARFGLLALLAQIICFLLIRQYPITSDFSAWYSGGTIFALGVFVAICGYGFYTSLGGQKVFAGKLLEE
jgi:hypothetical protein